MTVLNLPRGRTLHLDSPVVMGILNVTPDSFSDGGSFCQLDSAVKQAHTLLNQGAKIIDIGGESTRPGAPDVSLEDELERVIPLVKSLRATSDCIISIDTSKSEVMRQAIIAGADIINDVRALQEPGAIEVLAQYPEVAICLMHMQGQPRTMQSNPHYNDLFNDINEFFAERLAACEQAGIQQQRIILDPGFTKAKT
ncbi:MAG: dihydropteroate synthase, partial [Pseudomonadota bacterium]